jgi:hypothetical protein
MQYFSHTITTKLRTTNRWHKQLTILNITHFQLYFQITEKSINELLYTLLFIETWVEPKIRLSTLLDIRERRKAKAVPLQARGGPECSRNLRIPDFMTTAQEGG